MRVLRGFRGLEAAVDGSAVSIGNFDGVHRGHQAVICSAVRSARSAGLVAAVCTFDPHTRLIVEPDKPPRLLETLDQRVAAIDSLGVDLTVVIPFTHEVAAVAPEAFVTEFLRGELAMRSLHVSEQFKFGRGGSGNVEYLESRSASDGFELCLVPPVIEEGSPVSSTRIRDAIEGGRMEEASGLLGRPFALTGEVVRGDGRGRKLGAPTVNLAPESGCLPAAGVYVAELRRGEDSYRAVANVGVRPTFGPAGEISVEAHLLGVDEQLYGERVELAFLKRLRAEIAFEDGEALAAQIHRDVQQALAYFEA